MNRLGAYLFRLFSAEVAGLFMVALTILYLSQTVRIVDVDALRDRGVLTVLWQTVLALPPLSVAFLYLCIGVGVARVLRSLQLSRELHIMHVGQQLRALFGTILLFALAGTMVVLLLSHVVAPASKAATSDIDARAAADLVGRSLVPDRFASLGRGVTVSVGGRGPRGEITSFFADDRRDPEVRRTYIADSALITRDDEGYILQLEKGTIQYRTLVGQFSEISFERYDISLERLTGEADEEARYGSLTSLQIVQRQFEDGSWSDEAIRNLISRTGEGLRVLGVCLFVAAIAAFPSGRRREPLLPIEITVLAVLLVERAVSTYLPVDDGTKQLVGPGLLILVSTLVLLLRLRVLTPVHRREAGA